MIFMSPHLVQGLEHGLLTPEEREKLVWIIKNVVQDHSNDKRGYIRLV